MIVTHRRLASIAAAACCAVSAGGALATSASAATLTADKACYVNTATPKDMKITGTGWVPNATVQLSGGGTFANATADASGNVTFVNVPAPLFIKAGAAIKASTLTATATNPDGSQTIQPIHVRSVNLFVGTSPRTVRDVRKDKVAFSFSGFTPGKHIYGYWLRGKKIVGRDKFGKAHGPCGVLKQRAFLYPGGRPQSGASVFNVTFENTSRYTASAFPRVTGQLDILHF